MFEHIATAGINVSRQIDTGVFRGGTLTYQLLTWLDGEDLIEALPRMSQAEQFAVGEKCGAILRKMHTLPPLYDAEPWGIRFRRKVADATESCKPAKCREGDLLMRYLLDNQELLNNRPHTFTHGDWNTENIILSPGGQIGTIDIGGDKTCNDPWWDFCCIPGDLNLSPHFYTGQIKGYFDGEPPAEFFRLLAYYIAYCALEDPGFEYAKIVLNWFDDMRNPVPVWMMYARQPANGMRHGPCTQV